MKKAKVVLDATLDKVLAYGRLKAKTKPKKRKRK